jgi:hypothetical protein
VTFDAEVDDPVGRLANVVGALDVEAVIAPSLLHFGETIPHVLLRVSELNTVNPEATYTRLDDVFHAEGA